VNLPAFLNGAACLLAAAGSDTLVASRGHLLQALTRGSITVEFDQTPAREAFDHLERVLGIGIVGRYSDDRTGFGIDPATPITLEATNRAPIEVIEQILEQCADQEPCTWQIRHGYLEVGTKQRLSVAAALETRVYAIRDLMFEPTWFDNAPGIDIAAALSQTAAGIGSGGGGNGGPGGGGTIVDQPGAAPVRPGESDRIQSIADLIVQNVEPEVWDATGGPSTITLFTGTLVVRAPDFVHRQIGSAR
jgi:hypothetical protein